MDAAYFHLSNQFETLQVHASVVAQQSQQWLTVWFKQTCQFFQEVFKNQHMLQAQDIIEHIFDWIKRGWKEIQFQYYTTHFNIRGLRQQIESLLASEVLVAVPAWAPGTLAEYIVVPESQVVRQPKFFTFEASASFPYSGCLAWDALVNRSVIKEGNAKGKRVLVCGGNTPVGCILIQLVKLWGGYVVAICMPNAVSVVKALGADDVISLNGSDIDKILQLYDKYDAIFHTGGQWVSEHVLKRHLNLHGSYVSTIPERLTSDSLGFICGSIFAGYIRIRLLVQYIFGFNIYQWQDGSKINTTCLQSLCDLADADKLQIVIDKVYKPHNIEQALHHVLDPNAIGSTVITFQ